MTSDALIDAIKGKLGELKLSERKACLRAGLHVDAIRRIRDGFAPKIATLQKLAPVLGLQADYLISLAGLSLAPPVRAGPLPLEQVFIKGYVQGGAWRDAIEWDGSEWYSITVPADDRFPGVERFGLEVRGTSMDRLYPDGTIVIVVRFGDIGRMPQPGERVVCLRRDDNDNGYEATIKEYDRDAQGRHLLWPRSTDPDFQQPFRLTSEQLPVSGDYEPLPGTVHATPYDGSGSAPDIVISALVIQSVRRE